MFGQDYLDAWNSLEVERIVAFVAPDVDFEDIRHAHRVQGRAAFRRFIEGVVERMPNHRFEHVGSHDSDAGFVIEWVMQPDGIRGASVGRRVDGLIVEQRDYWHDPGRPRPS